MKRLTLNLIFLILGIACFVLTAYSVVLVNNNMSRIRVEWYLYQLQQSDDPDTNEFLARQIVKHGDKYDIWVFCAGITSLQSKAYRSLALKYMVDRVESLTHIQRENALGQPEYSVTGRDMKNWEEYGARVKVWWRGTVLVLFAISLFAITLMRTILFYSVSQGTKKGLLAMLILEPLFMVASAAFILLAFMPYYLPHFFLVQPVFLTLSTIVVCLLLTIISIFISYLTAMLFIRESDKQYL